MRRRCERRIRAHWIGADSNGIGICATSWATRNLTGRIQLDVGIQVAAQRASRIGDLALFQRPLVGRRVKLAEVINACILLRSGASLHEVRNSDCRQQANDGHDNHDFDEREARFADVF